MCVISMLGVKPGEIGDSIIMSRLEKGSVPVTVHIPTSKQQVRIHSQYLNADDVNACGFSNTEMVPTLKSYLSQILCVLQHPMSWLVQEMDSIQVEQKVVSCVSEKAKWWEGRRALDSRVEVSVEETRVLY